MKEMLKEIAEVLRKYEGTIEVDCMDGTIDITASETPPYYVEFGGYIDAELIEEEAAKLE